MGVPLQSLICVEGKRLAVKGDGGSAMWLSSYGFFLWPFALFFFPIFALFGSLCGGYALWEWR